MSRKTREYDGKGFMTNRDEWGRDPAVQEMRRLFREMEDRQKEFLAGLGLSWRDPRLRPWRSRALDGFNRAWLAGGRRGIPMDPAKAGDIYLACLAKALRADGVVVPSDETSGHSEFDRPMTEEGG